MSNYYIRQLWCLFFVFFICNIYQSYAQSSSDFSYEIDSLGKEFFKPHPDQAREQISWAIFNISTKEFLYAQAISTTAEFIAFTEKQKKQELLAVLYFQHALLRTFIEVKGENSMTYFLKAKEISLQTGRYDVLMNAYSWLANHLYRIKLYKESEKICNDAVLIFKNFNVKIVSEEVSSELRFSGIGLYNTMGLAQEKQYKLNEALASFRQAQLYAKEAGHEFWVAITGGNMGTILNKLGQWQQAIPLLEQDVAVSYRWDDFSNAVISLSEVAEIYQQHAQPKMAWKHIQTAVEWLHTKVDTTKYNYFPTCVKVYTRASAICVAQNKFKEAYQFAQLSHNKAKRYDEYMRGNETLRIQRQYDVERSQSDLKLEKANNKLLEQQKQQQEKAAVRNLWIAAIATICLLVVSALMISFFRQRRRLRRANLQIELQLEEIRQNNEQLQELDRFKRLLTGTIVHDLKNPLAMIVQQTQEPIIAQAARRMMNMVLNILEVDKLEELRYYTDIQSVNALQIVLQAIAQLSYQVEQKQLTITNKIPENLNIRADLILTERVFINLISNAIRFTPSGGSIEVAIQHNALAGRVIICVTDTGEGISPDDLPRIFDKFFQVNPDKQKAAYRSSGLGLTFCKLAMEAQNGHITAESVLGKGTSFFLQFPIGEVMDESSLSTDAALLSVDNSLRLSSSERAYLQPFAAQLQQKELYELSEITQILSVIDIHYSQPVKQWVSKVQDAVMNDNASAYTALLTSANTVS